MGSLHVWIRVSMHVVPRYCNITCPHCGWTQSQNLEKTLQKCKKCQLVNPTQYPYVGGVIQRLADDDAGDPDADSFLDYISAKPPPPDPRPWPVKRFHNQRDSVLHDKEKDPSVDFFGFRA